MIEINNLTRTKINESLVKEVSEKFLKKYKLKNKILSIAFVGDKRMKDLNRTYRKIDKTTDVLSFEGEEELLGEIVISFSKIKKQAKANKNTIKYELIFILVHGLLHLVGYDDNTEKKRLEMIKIGENFIKNNL